jgi:hypothetical protein
MTPCVLGTDPSDPATPPPCAACIAQTQANTESEQVRWFEPLDLPIVKNDLLGQDLERMLTYEYDGVPLGRIVLPSVRWILRRHTLSNDEPTRALVGRYILSAARVARQFSACLDEFQPQAVVVFNGMFYPEATARWLALSRGVRVISHEVGLAPLSAFFTPGEATAYPLAVPADFQLDDRQNDRLDGYLEKRFKGDFSMAGLRFWPKMQPLGEAFWQRTAQFKQVVPIFTNVVFDTSQGHANVVFAYMFAWLDQALAIIRAHPETFFVIRAHPDEARPGKESRESVREWIEKNGVDKLENVLFVDGGQYFSSYELIQRSKFVMVYNSTIGLEAAIMGAAVLSGGKARFTQLPTVYFPQTTQAFREKAEELLSAEHIAVPAEFKLNARRFLYYQLYYSSLPFEKFIAEDGVWNGYVRLKDFSWEALCPEQTRVMRCLKEGILEGKEFINPEAENGIDEDLA